MFRLTLEFEWEKPSYYSSIFATVLLIVKFTANGMLVSQVYAPKSKQKPDDVSNLKAHKSGYLGCQGATVSAYVSIKDRK